MVSDPPDEPGLENWNRIKVLIGRTTADTIMLILMAFLHLLCRILRQHPATADATAVPPQTAGDIIAHATIPIST
eukprot:CAMPEP_0177169788 /NCGR_PEP_ID=MMETSP0367-20130122/9757_1 /TAXON_ID=447022 ORGANISM="Scrippsiella hangoei-like, Strain SHHI-4" /NCGR_SAMPLE_ID=MMETSP0367 /ASSEMBLY_ACC=CAM_ASM_000362 /LENGTH=74 /DNA_ID=CAMNT_0018615953 /DNA_START=327 /DNA_END=547 /DNA_ORIENTATION=-